MVEIYNKKDEMFNFIIEKTGLPAVTIVWNPQKDIYIEYSENILRNYKIDY
jgi:hypothetical protein